MLKIKVKIMTS